MSKNWHPPYSEEFKARMVELIRAATLPALAEAREHWFGVGSGWPDIGPLDLLPPVPTVRVFHDRTRPACDFIP